MHWKENLLVHDGFAFDVVQILLSVYASLGSLERRGHSRSQIAQLTKRSVSMIAACLYIENAENYIFQHDIST